MFTVTIIGPDGVGKTTIVSRLQAGLPMPVKLIYMGDNVETSNYMLPTARWWKRRNLANTKAAKSQAAPNVNGHEKPGRANINPLRAIKKSIGFVNRILDVWYRYLVAAHFVRRGFVVLLDRHFTYDYYHFDIDPQGGRPSLKRRLNGFLLKHTLPDPDLVICLDAPAEVIFARKGEFSVEYIESRRGQYKSLEPIAKNFMLVDANRPLDVVVQEVCDIITDFENRKRRRLNHEIVAED
ncbi:MAG TPA: hypothetical protein VGA99_02700 [bacterium]